MQTDANQLHIMDLGRRRYGPVWRLQEELVLQRREGAIPDTLVFVEHDPVFTLGRNADEDNVTATPAQLQARGIELVHTSRGGDVTYHGPGQVVGYPIVDLRKRKLGVVAYVGALEQVLIAALARFDIEATTDPKNRGVWVDNMKIAALGVRITRHITMHGFALNVETAPDAYQGIVPCGIVGKGVTSMHLLRPGTTMEEVKPVLVEEFKGTLEYETVSAVGAPDVH